MRTQHIVYIGKLNLTLPFPSCGTTDCNLTTQITQGKWHKIIIQSTYSAPHHHHVLAHAKCCGVFVGSPETDPKKKLFVYSAPSGNEVGERESTRETQRQRRRRKIKLSTRQIRNFITFDWSECVNNCDRYTMRNEKIFCSSTFNSNNNKTRNVFQCINISHVQRQRQKDWAWNASSRVCRREWQ